MDYNPSTGLPMINDGVDCGGNTIGSSMWGHSSSSSMWDDSSSRYHGCRLPAREYSFLKFASVSSIIITLIAIFS